MNNKEECYSKIMKFINNDDKCILVKGTNQYKKHKLVMSIINKHYKNEKILFRVNGMENVLNNEFLGWTGIKKKVKSGKNIKIGNNYYQFDSIINSSTWFNTDKKFKFAIVYPIDPIIRNKKYEALENLFNHKELEKTFLISWTDSKKYDYNGLEKYINSIAIYDAEEENIGYHKRVIEIQTK